MLTEAENQPTQPVERDHSTIIEANAPILMQWIVANPVRLYREASDRHLLPNTKDFSHHQALHNMAMIHPGRFVVLYYLIGDCYDESVDQDDYKKWKEEKDQQMKDLENLAPNIRVVNFNDKNIVNWSEYDVPFNVKNSSVQDQNMTMIKFLNLPNTDDLLGFRLDTMRTLMLIKAGEILVDLGVSSADERMPKNKSAWYFDFDVQLKREIKEYPAPYGVLFGEITSIRYNSNGYVRGKTGLANGVGAVSAPNNGCVMKRIFNGIVELNLSAIRNFSVANQQIRYMLKMLLPYDYPGTFCNTKDSDDTNIKILDTTSIVALETYVYDGDQKNAESWKQEANDNKKSTFSRMYNEPEVKLKTLDDYLMFYHSVVVSPFFNNNEFFCLENAQLKKVGDICKILNNIAQEEILIYNGLIKKDFISKFDKINDIAVTDEHKDNCMHINKFLFTSWICEQGLFLLEHEEYVKNIYKQEGIDYPERRFKSPEDYNTFYKNLRELCEENLCQNPDYQKDMFKHFDEVFCYVQEQNVSSVVDKVTVVSRRSYWTINSSL